MNTKKSLKFIAVALFIILVTPIFCIISFAADFTVVTDVSAESIADMNIQGAWVVASGSDNATLLAVELPDGVDFPSDVSLALIFNGQNIGIRVDISSSFSDTYSATIHRINLVTGASYDTSMGINSTNATDGVITRGIISLGSDNTTMYYAYALSGYRYRNIYTGTYLAVSAPFVVWDGGQIDPVDSLFTFFINNIRTIVTTITSSPILMIALGVFVVGAVIALGFRLIRG